MQRYENGIMFKNEALLRTYPTSYFIKKFKKFCIDELPSELCNLSFGQLYGNADEDLVVDDIILSDENQKVSPQVRLAIPTYASNKKMQDSIKNKLNELALSTGYYFSSLEPYKYDKHIGLNDDVLVLFVTYEAKYSYMDI